MASLLTVNGTETACEEVAIAPKATALATAIVHAVVCLQMTMFFSFTVARNLEDNLSFVAEYH
jgi:hypothetical protein